MQPAEQKDGAARSEQRRPSINTAMRSVSEENQAKLLKRKKTPLARAMTKSSRILSIVEVAVSESELELPQSVRDFAAQVFMRFADSDTEEMDVGLHLLQALKVMGHNTNVHTLRDICGRFELEFPMHLLAHRGDNEKDDPERSGSGRDHNNNRDGDKGGLKTTVELDVFVAIVYSELIDQAQPTDLQKSFGLFDRDGNNEIDMDEFEAGLMALGDMNPLDQAGREAFLQKIDIDSDNTLSGAELINWLATDTFDEFRLKAGGAAPGPPSHSMSGIPSRMSSQTS